MKTESFGFISEGKGLFTEVSELDLIDVGGACGGGSGGGCGSGNGCINEPCALSNPANWGQIP
jgi:hypothetical protein